MNATITRNDLIDRFSVDHADASELLGAIDAAIAAAVKAEREACAKVADDAEHDGTVLEVRMKWKIAAAIRARSNGEGSK